jgi:hypothetical protein
LKVFSRTPAEDWRFVNVWETDRVAKIKVFQEEQVQLGRAIWLRLHLDPKHGWGAKESVGGVTTAYKVDGKQNGFTAEREYFCWIINEPPQSRSRTPMFRLKIVQPDPSVVR